MRKILIVEDEAPLREAYEMIISTGPYLVYTAKNGQEALELCEHDVYDLILLDIMMPVLDGIGFLEQFAIDENPQTKVIVMSNVSGGQLLDRAKELGAHTIMLKTDVSPRQLLATVRYELDG